MAKLIVIEGIDGAGKTTLCEYLYSKVPTKKKKLQSEPSNTVLGYLIKDALSSPPEAINHKVLERYFWMDREKQGAKTKKLLRDGYTIVQSRSIISGFVYSNTQPETKLGSILNYPKPDIVIYLECTPRLAYSRIASRGDVTTVYESSEYILTEKATKFNQVLNYFTEEQHWKIIRVNAHLSLSKMYRILTRYEDLV